MVEHCPMPGLGIFGGVLSSKKRIKVSGSRRKSETSGKAESLKIKAALGSAARYKILQGYDAHR